MTLAAGALTTLANAKLYMDAPPSDAVLSALIPRISGWILAALHRGFILPRTYSEQFSGSGTQQLVLPNYPLLTLSGLTVGGVSIPIAPQPNSDVSFSVLAGSPGFGYRFQPWNGIPPGEPAVLDLVGTGFYYGNQNVVANYSAGYQVTGEAFAVPATPFRYTPLAPFGIWASDEGVTYAATGAALTAVATTPSIGQYVPPAPDAATPVAYYQFAAADAGADLLINYGYVPAVLEQACIELLGERVAYRKRPGIRSQSLAAKESMSFDIESGLPNYILSMINNYISVVPPAMGALV